MNNLKLKPFCIKGMITLVVAISLAIPNLRVYSAIGDYQTSSQAITANNNYKKSSDRIEKPSALIGGFGTGPILSIAVSASLFAVAIASTVVFADASIEYNNVFIKNYQNYSKYTPSSMKPEF